MASSSTNVATDVYDIECVPRYADFTSPNLDHDETIGDKWFELQECQQSTPIDEVVSADEVSPVVQELPSLVAEEERPVVQKQQTSTAEKKCSVVRQLTSSSTKKRPLTQGSQASSTPDQKNPVHRSVVPQPIKFATDERIKRRSQSRDTVRTAVDAGPPTPADQRPKPFMQGLRQYDKPTGSPARKALTQPNPFHFHELKPREKKIESHQPVIKSRPPVPQHTVKPPPTKPLRAVVPPVAIAGASPKPQVPIVGRPPNGRRVIRRSASSSNVRTGDLPPPANNGATTGRCSLVDSAPSANKENMEQGATHGLQVYAKDRGRCRERGPRSTFGTVAGPTTPVDQRPKPFMQGLRQYDKPTGSPALKPLTQPNPFHFHELKSREKKIESQQPVIKSKPPVPQNAAKPPPTKPLRATARPSVDGAVKQLPIAGRPPVGQRSTVIRRSVSATNVRSGEVPPTVANSNMISGVISGRSSLAGSTTSLNVLEQGATHGLHVAVKDRSRSRGRQRGGRR